MTSRYNIGDTVLVSAKVSRIEQLPSGRILKYEGQKTDHRSTKGYCVFFMNGGRGMSEPKYRIPLSAENQEILDILSKEL